MTKINYNQYLPYPIPSNESSDWLVSIKSIFIKSVESRDFSIGLTGACRQLQNYLKLGNVPSIDDRASLAGLLYDIAVSDVVDDAVAALCANLCYELLKKQRDTAELAPILKLPWRPLWEKIDGLFKGRKRSKVSLEKIGNTQPIVRLLTHCRRFFAAEAAAEILEKAKPLFYPLNIGCCLQFQTFLVHFLPDSAVSMVEVILDLWPRVVHVPIWDHQFLNLVARFAKHRFFSHEEPFSPKVLEAAFAAAKRLSQVAPSSTPAKFEPVPDGIAETGLIRRLIQFTDLKEAMDSFAAIVVYSLSSSSKTFSLLEIFVRSIETFLHPSNRGPWSDSLHSFFKFFCKHLLRRHRRSLDQPNAISDTAMSQIIDLIRPVLLVAMWGKDAYQVEKVYHALTCLCWIAPDDVFPALLERIYPALENVTQVHQTTSCIALLGYIGFPLMQWPSAENHYFDLLELVLPGLDANDASKTSRTCLFISRCFMVRPLAEDDCGAQEWLMAFLQKCFTLFVEASSHPASSHGGDFNEEDATQLSKDDRMVPLVQYTLSIVISQLDAALFELAAAHVIRWIGENTLTAAVDVVSRIASSLTCADEAMSEGAFAKLLKLCDTRIRSEIDHGAGSNTSSSSSSSSETALYWYQSVLESALAGASARALCQTKSLWLPLLQFQVKAIVAHPKVKVVARMFHSIGGRLLDTYPTEKRSHATDTDAWVQIDKVDLEWYTPSLEALNVMDEMCNAIVPDLLAALGSCQANDAGWCLVTYLNGMLRALSIFQRDTKCTATGAIVAKWLRDTSANSFNDDNAGVPNRNKRMLVTSTVDFKQYTKLCDMRIDIIKEIYKFSLRTATASVSSESTLLKAVVRSFDTFLNQRGVQRTEFRNVQRFYDFLKPSVNPHFALCPLKPRALWIFRLQVAHAARLKHNCMNGLISPLCCTVFSALLRLSTNSYLEVRRIAQAAAVNTLHTFSGLRYATVPFLLDTCLADESCFEREHSSKAKGYLYLLCDTTLLKPLLRSWEWIYKCVLIMERGHKSDIPLIHDLLRKLFVQALMLCGESKADLDGSYLQNIESSFLAAIKQNVSLTVESTSDYVRETNCGFYEKTISKFAQVIQSADLPWRWTSMSLGLLDLLIKENETVPACAIDALLQALISKLPLVQRYAQFAFTRVLYIIKTQSTFSKTNAYSRLKLQMCATDLRPCDSFIDDTTLGYFGVFPESFKVYLANTATSLDADPFKHTSYTESLQQMRLRFSNENYVLSLLQVLSVEANSTGSNKGGSSKGGLASADGISDASVETFGHKNAELFRSIFQTFPDLLASDVWRDQWCVFATSPQRTTAQERCAAELFAGSMRALKHLPRSYCDSICAWYVERIKLVMGKMSPSLLKCWLQAVRYIFTNRDPKRYTQLLRVLISNAPFEMEASFFGQAKHIACALQIVRSCGWRLSSSDLNTITNIFDASDTCWSNSYHQVRQLLSQLWFELYATESIQNSFSWVGPRLIQGSNDSFKAPSGNTLSNLVGQNGLEESKLALSTGSSISESFQRAVAVHDCYSAAFVERILEHLPSEKDTRCNALKSVLEIFGCLYSYHWLTTFFNKDLGTTLVRLVLCLSQMQDTELLERGKIIFRETSYISFGSFTLLSANMIPLLDLLQADDKLDNSWHWKAQILPVVYGLYFRHAAFTFSHSYFNEKLFVTCMHLLPNATVEIRELAKDTLSGYLQCLLRSQVEEHATSFTKIFAADSSFAVKAKLSPQALAEKHAVVLALCSLVLAFPYELPSWMPAVLEKLAFCLSLPSPINDTVKKVFSEFKRTHVDTWHQDILMFTEDQKNVLTELLVGPNYYA